MEELPVITISFEIYKKLLELNTSLDRKYRYSLGEQTIKSWTDCMEQLLLAKYAPKPLKASFNSRMALRCIELISARAFALSK